MKKGNKMIKTMSIRNVTYADYDEVWAIVRSMKNPSPKMKQIASLSPDWNLFKTYLNLKESGEWNTDSFQSIYRPQFMSQIAKNADSQKALETLKTLDAQGKNIALVCFCPDKNLCHRSLVAQILKDMGCNVICE